MDYIVTHQRPDMDAIMAAYLLMRYEMAAFMTEKETEMPIRFVPAGTTDTTAWAVVDTGGEYDPHRLRFDHHGCGPDGSSASQQVFNYLLEDRGFSVDHLEQLVDLVHRGDTGSVDDDVRNSYRLGLHALIGAMNLNHSDEDVFRLAYTMLESLDDLLFERKEATMRYRDRIVWANYPVVALQDASQAHTQAAHDEGYTLVVWNNLLRTADGVSYAVGVSRIKGVDAPNIGEVLKNTHLYPALVADGWFFHPSGFFAGRGTGKSQRDDPSPIDVGELARALHSALGGGALS